TPSFDCNASSTCLGRLDDSDIITPDRGTIVGKSPLFCWGTAEMDSQTCIGHNVPTRHYWVTIARDSNFTTIVQQAYLNEPCYAPSKPMVAEGTLYYSQVIPAAPNGSFPTIAGTSGGFLVSPSFQHASVPPTPI